MLKKFFVKYHIVFQRENSLRVLILLCILPLVEYIWKKKKKIKKIESPIIHLYAVCWNEAKILPFVMDYYAQFVDHFFIYDNYSDDETDEILKNRPNVTVHKFDTGGTFNDITHQELKNTVWKKSRGRADWVIVIDMDELIFVPDIQQFLSQTNSTIFRPQGYSMVGKVFPDYNSDITSQIRHGVADEYYSKMAIFNPNRIININYRPGAHEADPEGIVILGENCELKLLHYKYISVDYVLNRMALYNKRMSPDNIQANYAVHYKNADYQSMENTFHELMSKAKPVL